MAEVFETWLERNQKDEVRDTEMTNRVAHQNLDVITCWIADRTSISSSIGRSSCSERADSAFPWFHVPGQNTSALSMRYESGSSEKNGSIIRFTPSS
jgi:hypothetical protein